jgi:site-specific DNA-methyltransferase (adenine-specific)
MRYLCRLITPKGGTILEPFAGSGTTLIASHLEGFKHIGIEREEDYVKIIRARLRHWAGVRDPIETQKASAQRQLRLFS